MRFSTICEMLQHWAAINPELPSITYSDITLSRSEVLSRFEDKRARFSSFKSVGFLLGEPDADEVITLLAAIGSGLRVSLLDEALPDELLGTLIKNAECDALEGDKELCDELLQFLCEPKCSSRNEVLFYTSGTTSRSKAVVLSEASLCASAYNGGELLPLSVNDRLLSLLPLNHVFGFVCSLLWPLSCGAEVAIGRGMRHISDDFEYYRPTAVSLVPALADFFTKRGHLNDELSLVLIGAGDCPSSVVSMLHAFGKRVCFGYGLTETSSGVALSVGDDVYAMDICPDYTVTIAPDGEVLVKCPGAMMQGYFRDPEGTACVLRDGVLSTGDLGYIDEHGRLHITGRKKEMLVLPGGTKIFLPEYEKSIAEVLGSDEICVFLRGGAPALAVAEGDEGEILALLRPLMEKYPRSEQISRVFVRGKNLPRTKTGKIKRYEVEALFGGKS